MGPLPGKPWGRTPIVRAHEPRQHNTSQRAHPRPGARGVGAGERVVSVLFALVVSLCAAVLAVLFVTMWLDGDGVTTTALAVALLPMVVLTMLAWGEAL